MERSLCLILNGGKNNKMHVQEAIYLTLETMDAKKLDEYISKNFNSSEEVRKKYAAKIDPFLEKYRSLLDRVEEETGRTFNGSIVITELGEDLMLERKKVLYKKDIVLFREVTKQKDFVLSLERRDYLNYYNALTKGENYSRLFVEYYGRELRFCCCSDDKFKRIMGSWRNSIKESYSYYEIIRRTLKSYNIRHKEFRLDSLDVLYTKYLQELERRKQTRKMAEIEADIEDLESITTQDRLSEDLMEHMSDYAEPKRFKTHADEDGYPGDLEPWATDIIKVEDKVINDLSGLNKHNEEPTRFKTYADEEGYPGDLEVWGTDIIPDEDELEAGREHGRTKTLNNGHHGLFNYES